MVTKLHIVDCNGTNRIVKDTDIKEGKITIYHYDDEGESYQDKVPVTIKSTFLAIIHTEFIRNDKKDGPLNAYYISGGFGQVNRLAYAYSVTIIDISSSSYQLYESNCIWSASGIKETRFDMYSYHVNEPKQEYLEWRLDYEVFEQLDMSKIFNSWLNTSDKRDIKIDNLLK